MKIKKKSDKWAVGNQSWYAVLQNYIFPLILLLYPLRHIWIGVDLWDTGYNYANFRYMGLDNMDSMWLFSTYLSNAVGHFLTLLPGGHTLLGMNFYTGLTVCVLALTGYYFCTKKLNIPSAVAFLGEFAAVSLCWCPTALLYNYLTYILFFAGVILLYQGLVKEKPLFLVFAGVALGSNIFVRFPNLTEAVLIVALWGYGILKRKKLKQVAKETGLCLLGYVGAVVVFLGYISLRYGFSSYVEAITRLFGMTETAKDYQATSMLGSIFSWYMKNLYWVIRLAFFMVLGMLISIPFPQKFHRLKKAAAVFFSGVAIVWLYKRNFCSPEFDNYNAMLLPAILFLMLTLFICMIQIFRRGTAPEEKLLALMTALVVFFTSIGSNNGLYPSINNLFLAAPYTFFAVWKFCRYGVEKIVILKERIRDNGKKVFPGEISVSLFPAKAVCVAFLLVFLFQGIGFGTQFVFVETKGAKNTDTKIENSDILKGIYMSEERAEWLGTLTEYVTENKLTGREVILYGNVPSLSFYLDMPSAFNPWSDLASYSVSAMEAALTETESEIEAGAQCPVVIFNKDVMGQESTDEKQALIVAYMDKYQYTVTFENDKFALYEAGKRSYD